MLQELWPALEMSLVCHWVSLCPQPVCCACTHPWQLGVPEPGASAAFGAAVSQPPPERCEEQRGCFHSLFHTLRIPGAKLCHGASAHRQQGLGSTPWVRAGHRLCVPGWDFLGSKHAAPSREVIAAFPR